VESVSAICAATLGNKQGSGVEKSQLCLWIGRCLRVDGRIQETVRWLEESCRWRNSLDEEHPDRLASQHELARAYRADGQVKKAVELRKHVVAVKAKVLRDDHPSRLVSQEVLADLYAELAVNPDLA